MPAGLRAIHGTATLRLAASRTDTGAADALDLVLAETPGDPAAFGAQPQELVQYFAVAPGDVAPVRALQQRITAWKAEAPADTAGSLSVGLGGCTVDGGPAPGAEGSVYIRTEADGPFLPLIDRGSIEGLVGQDAMAAMQPCPQT
jgi:hypothetical protein